MKKKLFGLLAAFLAFTALGVMSACGGKTPTDSSTPDGSTPGPGTPWVDEMDCRVTVESEGGMKVSGITVKAFDEDGALAKEVVTNGKGIAEMFLEEGNYSLTVENIPLGYYLSGFDYSLSPERLDETITLGIEPVEEADRKGHIYQVGDVVHDFTVETFSGETLSLYEILEEKEMVMLNFWYVSCPHCLKEMPWMQNAYVDERFAGKFEIIALHVNVIHSLDEAVDCTQGDLKNCTFPFTYHSMTTIEEYFPVTNYPATYIIDRYGVLAYSAVGRFEDQEECTLRVAKYLGPDYVQDFSNSGEQVDDGSNIELIEPTVPDPTDAALNSALDTTGLEFALDENKYVWPFIVTEKDGRECIYAPNGQLGGLNAATTSSALTVKINVPKENYEDYVFTFDYKLSSEEDGDFFHVFVDDVLMQSHSGSTDWTTCYAYVPVKGGEHTLTFIYAKDATESVDDDTVYIDNLRFEPLGENSALVFRHAATERLSNEEGYKASASQVETSPRFGNYAQVYFNETDGLYHVHSENGPLLFANLMNTSTQWSSYALYDRAASGHFVHEDGDLVNLLTQYANAENHSDNGYVPVNEELAGTLQFIAERFGSNQENEWLEMCCYYDAYNTEHVKNPCEGVHFYYATVIQMDYTQENPEARAVVDIQKLIMPRGYKYAFTPERSGVYSISSDRSIAKKPDEMDPILWMTNGQFNYNEAGEIVFPYEEDDAGDFHLQVRLTAGVTYYLVAADWDKAFLGDKYELVVKYLGADVQQALTFCAKQPYVSIIGPDDTVIGTKANGVQYDFDEEGYARTLNLDGSFGSYIYADMLGTTHLIPNMSLKTIINGGSADYGDLAFDFSDLNINGNPVLDEDGNPYGNYLDAMKKYLAEAEATTGDLYGYVKVTKELQQLLRLFAIKVHNEEILEAWQCVCYYYRTI